MCWRERETRENKGFRLFYSVPMLWYPSEREAEQDGERECE